MLLRVIGLFFLACAFPAMASLPQDPMRQVGSQKAAAVLQLAQKEMPLPVTEVRAQPLRNGKLEVIIEMSTAGQSWAPKPVMYVAFEISQEGSAHLIEQAILEVAHFTRAFIEAAKRDSAIKAAQGPQPGPDREAR